MRLNTRLSMLLAGLSLFATDPIANADSTATDTSKVLQTQVLGPFAKQKQELISAYTPFLAELEGTRYNVYDDKGKPAIGWGYNFDTKKSAAYDFLEIAPIVPEGEISLNKKDMAYFASGVSLEALYKYCHTLTSYNLFSAVKRISSYCGYLPHISAPLKTGSIHLFKYSIP